MTDTRDGYAEWLSVATAMRPPNHYQLLGLKDFESDRAKIAAAAEAAQSRLLTVAPGDRLDEWQRILDELSVAKLVLADAARKGQYDGQLRSRLASRAGAPGNSGASTGGGSGAPASSGGAGSAPAARSTPAGAASAGRPSGADYALPPAKKGAGRPAASSSNAESGPAAPQPAPATGKPRTTLASLGIPAAAPGDASPAAPAAQPQNLAPQQPPSASQPQPIAQQPYNPSMFPQPQPFAAQPQPFQQSATPQPLAQPSFAAAGPQLSMAVEPQAVPSSERLLPLPGTSAPQSAPSASAAPLAGPATTPDAPGPNGGSAAGALRPLPGAGGVAADGVVVRNTPRPVPLAGRPNSAPAVPEPARNIKGPAGGKEAGWNQKNILIGAGVGALVLVVLIVFTAPHAPHDGARLSQADKPKHLNPLGDRADDSGSRDQGHERSDDERATRRKDDDSMSSDSESPPAAKPKKPKAAPKRKPAAEEPADESQPPAEPKSAPPKKRPPATEEPTEMAPPKPPGKPADSAMARSDRPEPPAMSKPAPAKPASQPEDSPPDPEQTAAFQKALLRVRGLLAARNVDAVDGALQEAKSLARSAEQRAEVARLNEFAGYVAGFWNAVRESMKGLQTTDEIKIGSTALTVVSADQNEVTFHRPGRNDTYTVMNMPGGVAFALAERWYDKVNPVNKIYLGAFHAADPSGDPSEARRLWEAASKSGASSADLMPLLDLPRVQPAGAGATVAEDKSEKGDKTALAKADRAFLQKYGPEMRAATAPQERLDLADRLLADARAASDAAEKTILFRRACELVSKVAISNATPDDVAHSAAEKAVQLIDQALEEKHPENAKNLGQAVIMAARKSKDETLMKDATERSKKLQEAMKQDNS